MRRMLVLLVGCGACSYEPPTATGDDAPLDSPTDGPTSDASSDGGSSIIVIEAETPTLGTSADRSHLWVVETAEAGFSGTGYVTALPNDNDNCFDPTDLTCGALNRYDFVVAFAGRYRITVRHRSPNGGADSLHWYLTAAGVDRIQTEDLDPDVTTAWIDDTSTTTATLPIGPASFMMRMRQTGTRVDQIRLALEP